MLPRLSLVVLLALNAPANVATAQNSGTAWDVTVKMEIVGMPMALPPTTMRICVPKEASDDAYVPRNDDCKLTESRRSGQTQRFKMVCTGKEAMTAEGEITHAGDTYRGKLRMLGKMEGQSMEMSQTFDGKKVGSCTPPPTRR